MTVAATVRGWLPVRRCVLSASRCVAATSLLLCAPGRAAGVGAARETAGFEPQTIALRVEAIPQREAQAWEVRVVNASPFPVSVVDDDRLVWLDVTISGRKPERCRLPSDMLPADGASLATKSLLPGESVSHVIDLRFYCYGHDALNALGSSAQVTPNYGFPEVASHQGRRSRAIRENGPFVAIALPPTDAAALKSATGASVAFAADQAPVDSVSSRHEAKHPALVLEMARGSDAHDERSVRATVRLRNTTAAEVRVYVRRSLFSFDVKGPDGGTTTCEPADEVRHPARLGFTTLAPHGSVTLPSRLVELCPRGTFAERGAYLVTATFDSEVTGERVGLQAFTGRLAADHPVVVRVRRSIRIVPNHWAPLGDAPAPPPTRSSAPPGAAPPRPPPLPSPATASPPARLQPRRH